MSALEKEGTEPDCWFRRCEAAHLMNPGFWPWLQMFALLRGELLAKHGIGRYALEEAEWLDFQSMLIFEAMNTALEQALQDRADIERQMRGNG